MARYRRVLRRQEPQVADLRRLPGNGEPEVKPASDATNDGPELTDADLAPEASSAAEEPKRTRKAKK